MITTPQHLHAWAVRHGIASEALRDLVDLMGAEPIAITGKTGKSEAAVSADIRLVTSALGWRMWRNNVGMLRNAKGVPVRYGLCNESKQMNERYKSADHIGIRPVTIGPEHIGQTIGQFASIETKPEGWHYTGNGREPAQLRWAEVVTALGGYAIMTDSVDKIVNSV